MFTHRTYIGIDAGAKGHCFVRKLRIAQLRTLTISRHVIAVSAQQRDNEKGVRCIRRRSGSPAGQFFNAFVVFFLAVYSCSLLIPLLLNRFNVVVVNGHDDIEMWTIGSANFTTRTIRPSDSLELEEAFILNVGRKGRYVGFNSSY